MQGWKIAAISIAVVVVAIFVCFVIESDVQNSNRIKYAHERIGKGAKRADVVDTRIGSLDERVKTVEALRTEIERLATRVRGLERERAWTFFDVVFRVMLVLAAFRVSYDLVVALARVADVYTGPFFWSDWAADNIPGFAVPGHIGKPRAMPSTACLETQREIHLDRALRLLRFALDECEVAGNSDVVVRAAQTIIAEEVH